MRTQPRDTTEPQLFKCGTRSTTVVTSTGGFAFNFFCKRWDCETCRKFKIKKIQDRIASFKGIFVFTGDRPLGKAHFIERHIHGDYVCVRFDTGYFMICEQTFPNSMRRDKRTFIAELPTLMKPINEGRRVSFRPLPPAKDEDGNIIPKDTTDDYYLGRVAGDHVSELKNMTPEEKVDWLLQQPERIIFPAGLRLLRPSGRPRG